jgi:hypothetical protein
MRDDLPGKYLTSGTCEHSDFQGICVAHANQKLTRAWGQVKIAEGRTPFGALKKEKIFAD